MYAILFYYGSPSWIRTNDQMVNSHLLYRWAMEEYINILNECGMIVFLFLKKSKFFLTFFINKNTMIF